MKPDPKYMQANGEFVDPVCAMTVRPDGPHHFVHDDHEYRFCSAGCKAKFAADPATYLPRDPQAVKPQAVDRRHGRRPPPE